MRHQNVPSPATALITGTVESVARSFVYAILCTTMRVTANHQQYFTLFPHNPNGACKSRNPHPAVNARWRHVQLSILWPLNLYCWIIFAREIFLAIYTWLVIYFTNSRHSFSYAYCSYMELTLQSDLWIEWHSSILMTVPTLKLSRSKWTELIK